MSSGENVSSSPVGIGLVGVSFAFGSDRWQDVSGEWGAMLRTGVFSPLELLRMRCVDAPRGRWCVDAASWRHWCSGCARWVRAVDA